jgi:hypothetical protein
MKPRTLMIRQPVLEIIRRALRRWYARIWL